MKNDVILMLPKKFDFVSNINSLTKGIIYHAECIGDTVKITWCLDGKRISEDEESFKSMCNKIKNRRYVIINK